jgi:hypothetical protein
MANNAGSEMILRRAPVGRPRTSVSPTQVGHLRERGASWREISRTLGIGIATAVRLYNAAPDAPDPFQNSRDEATGAEVRLVRVKRLHQPPSSATPDAGGRPGRCGHCGSSVWRLYAGGFVQCTICVPLTSC